MTVQELVDQNLFQTVSISSDAATRKIEKTFCCDLLSIAMGKAPADSAWITVMGNINTLAVASLADVSCIILAENVQLDPAAIEKAKQQDISVLKTDLPVFEAALLVYQQIS